MSNTLHTPEPDGSAVVMNDGVLQAVVSRSLAGAVGQRLAACPNVRPEAVADGRALLASDHPPSSDEVAGALMHSLVDDRLT